MIALTGATVTVPSPPDSRRSILTDIDLDIAPGECVALVGGNGAGKTTLLGVIAGVRALSAGALTVGRGDERPSVGLLLQEPDNQLVMSTVYRELALSSDGDGVEEATRRFGLEGLWDRNPHELSGGEKQRLALATVWLQEPDVLLLDEPTAFLDEPSRERCVEFVRELHAGGVTVVWATPGDPVSFADTVVALDGGRVAFCGAVDEYLAWPGRKVVEVSPPLPRERSALPSVAAGESVVEFDHVSFAYDGGGDVLSQLSLSVGRGECVGIAGRNGAGKSTVLLLAGGVLQAGGGRLERRFTRTTSQNQQHVFYLPQSPERMFFAETVLEELSFGLRRLGATREEAKQRAAAALEGVGLDPGRFLDRQPFQLSYGEMRRVAFAVAEVLEPSLLLLDEPTASLDPEGVGLFYRLVERHRRSGTTLMVASHDPHALDACDRVVELDQKNEQ